MKQGIIFLLILLSSLQCKADTISAAAHQKYPYTLLTDSYGILSDFDLDASKEGLNPAPFPPKEGVDSISYLYWQCFPCDSIFTRLEDLGYSSEDIGFDENYGDLRITAFSKPGVSHEYVIRRTWPLVGFQKRFNLWLKLMKGEKYVCIEGIFFNCQDRIVDAKNQQVCSWIFEKLKTKKGCDSYFQGGCHSDHSKHRAKNKLA